jgi:hypothetical protein
MDLVLNAVVLADYLLQVLLLVLLSRGFVRKYSTLFAYSILLLMASTAEVLVSTMAGRRSSLYSRLYWSDEVIVDLMLFLLVIVLTRKALEGNPLRSKADRLLGGVVIAVLVLPFILFYGRGLFTPRWFNRTSQMLNFGGAIMNLALWSALLLNKKRDSRLVTVSAGLGVAVTGAAISYGVRYLNLTPTELQLAAFLKTATHLGSMIIWCWAFWPAAKPRPVTPSPVSSPG